MSSRQMEIGLLGHDFTSPNLGVKALSISHLSMLNRVVMDLNLTASYTIVELRKVDEPTDGRTYLKGISDSPIRFYAFSLKKFLKRPVLYVNLFRDCDVVFDLSAGDSFTDIYGWKRFILQSLGKYLAIRTSTPLVLAPQTIGPFNNAVARRIANRLMLNMTQVFVRDALSLEYMHRNGLSHIAQESIDVAFRLPSSQDGSSYGEPCKGKIQIGVNVSGLLYNGGYTRKNQFGLKFDYKGFVDELLALLTDNLDYEIHLVPHVISDIDEVEDDYRVCVRLKETFPTVKLSPRFSSPIEAKSYISKMDFFVGSRMHSTIAAFSSGIPVVPVAYSRKFRGLFRSLDYDYVADGTIQSKEGVIKMILGAIENRKELEGRVAQGNKIATTKLQAYENFVSKVLEGLDARKK